MGSDYFVAGDHFVDIFEIHIYKLILSDDLESEPSMHLKFLIFVSEEKSSSS